MHDSSQKRLHYFTSAYTIVLSLCSLHFSGSYVFAARIQLGYIYNYTLEAFICGSKDKTHEMCDTEVKKYLKSCRA